MLIVSELAVSFQKFLPPNWTELHIHCVHVLKQGGVIVTTLQRQHDSLSETQAGQQVVGRQAAPTPREGWAASV